MIGCCSGGLLIIPHHISLLRGQKKVSTRGEIMLEVSIGVLWHYLLCCDAISGVL